MEGSIYRMQIKPCHSLPVFHLIALFFCVLSSDVSAANFTVNPIRIFFDGAQKTNVLSITNTSDEPVSLELKAVAWGHDNTYTPTKDIIFFPKMLTINKGEEKIIRIGHRISVEQLEKTYRLFIKEIPDISPEGRTELKMVMNLGVPIFIMPSEQISEGEIEKTDLSNGELTVSLKNTGNVHFVIQSIAVSGIDDTLKEIFSANMAGWYLLAGSARDYTFEIPEESCLNIKNLQVNVETDKPSMEKKFGVIKEMCTP